MNKKGWTWGQMASAIIVLVVLGLLIAIATGGLGSIWKDIKTALGFPSEQLEGLKGITAPEVRRIEVKSSEMRGLLKEAINHVKNKQYNDAIKTYIKYYKECEKVEPKWISYTCSAVKKEGVKFRVLNVLREEYYALGLMPSYQELHEDVRTIIEIEEPEFKSAILLVKTAAYTTESEFEKALAKDNEYRNNYQSSDKNKFNQLYFEIVSLYRYIKKYKPSSSEVFCKDALKYSEVIKNEADKLLEQENKYLDIADFDVLDYYQFLSQPYNYIKENC